MSEENQVTELKKAILDIQKGLGGMLVDFHGVLEKAYKICEDEDKTFVEIMDYLNDKMKEIEERSLYQKYKNKG